MPLTIMELKRAILARDVEIRRLQQALAEPMEAAARIAESIQPSAASAVGEAHMRSYRDAIAHAIRTAHPR